MHGMVIALFKTYMISRHGAAAWSRALKQADREGEGYLASQIYPDEEMALVVGTAAEVTRNEPDALLQDFGVFLAPHLHEMYGWLIKPEWRTRELLLNVEGTIHRIVRQKNPGAKPPVLRFSEAGPDALRFEYDSARRMSALAIGIMQGMAASYHESLDIDHERRPDGSSLMMVRIRPLR